MKSIKSVNLRVLILIFTAFASFIFVVMHDPIPQPVEYHRFIDSRSFFGIPNFFDVVSNVFFLVLGVVGFKVSKTNSWKAFFISVFFVAPGSAYYHWAPSNSTLVWDRLPMSAAFMALYTALLSEHFTKKFEKTLPLMIWLGVSSVISWAYTDDLRFYVWVQFSSFLTVPMILFLFKSKFSSRKYIVLTMIFYGLAKLAEAKDREVFTLTHELMSGHTLKHLLAALGIAMLWKMLKTRRYK